jgi:PAS domain-containing protein
MKIDDLETFQNAPFLLWVEDEQWRYLWGNRAICDLADESVVEKRTASWSGKPTPRRLLRTTKKSWPQANRITFTNWSTTPSMAKRP